LLVRTHWLAITNFFPMNGISEVVDLSRHDWNNLGFSNDFFLSGKSCFSKGQEDFCVLLGF